MMMMVMMMVIKTMMMILFHPDKIQKRICQFCFHFLATAQCAVHIIWPKLSSGGFIILLTGLTLMTWFWNLCLQEPETERCDYYESDLEECWLGNALGKQIIFGNILGRVGQCSGQEAVLQGNILAKVAGRHNCEARGSCFYRASCGQFAERYNDCFKMQL